MLEAGARVFIVADRGTFLHGQHIATTHAVDPPVADTMVTLDIQPLKLIMLRRESRLHRTGQSSEKDT